MNWFSRLIGPPTLREMAGRVMSAAVKCGLAEMSLSARDDELHGRIDNRPVTVYLGNLFIDYCATPRARRSALISSFVSSLLSGVADDSVPASYDVARARLMPVVRTRDDIGIASLAIRRSGVSDAADAARALPVTGPLAGELLVAIVYDAPASMGYITADRLVTWGVDFPQALADALDNLRARPESPGWVELAQGVWSGEWGDAYESSRLLLPDLIQRRGMPDPIALVPFRSCLLLASARDPLALTQMAGIAHNQLDHRPRRLSFRPLRLDGRSWQPLVMDSDASALFGAMSRRNRASAYAAQKALLEDLHQRRGTEVFVASFSVAEGEGRPPFSLAVWSEGVDSLLPEAEVVMLRPVRPAGTETVSHLPVRWADLQAVAGGLMEPAELQPPRFRVRGFPDETSLQALRARAVSL